MTDRPARVGIISFAHPHAIGYTSLLRDTADVEILTHDPDPYHHGELRGKLLADKLRVAYVGSLDELFMWEPDAVIVTSENARHREFVERAAAEGVDVLCEKPLATTEADGVAIAEAVAIAGVRLMVAFPVRFASSITQAKAMLDNGSLGELVSVHGANNGKLPVERAWFTNPALSGGGALADHIVHLADVIDYLTGAAPTAVTATTNRILHAERATAETGGLVTIQYEGGLVAAIDCSWSRPDTAPTWGGLTFTLVGTGGTLDVDVFGPRLHGVDGRYGAAIELSYAPDYDRMLLNAFLGTVRGERPPTPGIESGLRTLRIVLAAQESAVTRSTVRISGA